MLDAKYLFLTEKNDQQQRENIERVWEGLQTILKIEFVWFTRVWLINRAGGKIDKKCLHWGLSVLQI